MWIVELLFSSVDPVLHAARLGARQAHRDSLAALAADGRLLAAGPLADGSGAVLVFDVSDRSAVEALVQADPYFGLPAVEIVSVREWSPVVERADERSTAP
ncbi:YciI family protein [Kitasatospora purpeofusca]|uniref:YciI family protein n=1 Tax=Kitasatospora purpeofusca TaxID=67352 RepID=UPI0030F36CDD